jgi:hypothetical protein
VARLHAFVYAVIDGDCELDTKPTTEAFDVEHESPEEVARALAVWLHALANSLGQALVEDQA